VELSGHLAERMFGNAFQHPVGLLRPQHHESAHAYEQPKG
jgi:hypothetical protein